MRGRCMVSVTAQVLPREMLVSVCTNYDVPEVGFKSFGLKRKAGAMASNTF